MAPRLASGSTSRYVGVRRPIGRLRCLGVVAVASVLALAPAVPAGAANSANNYFFSIGSGSSRVCGVGYAGLTGGDTMTATSTTLSLKGSTCGTPYAISASSFQNRISLYYSYPAIACGATAWYRPSNDGVGHWIEALQAGFQYNACGPQYYVNKAEHKYYFPFSWFYGTENSPVEFCLCGGA